MREGEISAQGWLYISVDEQDAVADVGKKAAQIGGNGGLAYSTFGSDNAKNKHFDLCGTAVKTAAFKAKISLYFSDLQH